MAGLDYVEQDIASSGDSAKQDTTQDSAVLRDVAEILKHLKVNDKDSRYKHSVDEVEKYRKGIAIARHAGCMTRALIVENRPGLSFLFFFAAKAQGATPEKCVSPLHACGPCACGIMH